MKTGNENTLGPTHQIFSLGFVFVNNAISAVEAALEGLGLEDSHISSLENYEILMEVCVVVSKMVVGIERGARCTLHMASKRVFLVSKQ